MGYTIFESNKECLVRGASASLRNSIMALLYRPRLMVENTPAELDSRTALEITGLSSQNRD